MITAAPRHCRILSSTSPRLACSSAPTWTAPPSLSHLARARANSLLAFCCLLSFAVMSPQIVHRDGGSKERAGGCQGGPNTTAAARKPIGLNLTRRAVSPLADFSLQRTPPQHLAPKESPYRRGHRRDLDSCPAVPLPKADSRSEPSDPG